MNKLVYEVVLALLPVAFVIFLGWYAGYKKIIDNKHAESIAGYVMNFSFPAALFVLTASSRPSEIFNGKFVLAFWIGLLGMNIIAFFIYKMRRFSLKESGMGSFTCSVPDMTFMGIPIFTSLFGVKSLIAIAIGNVCYGLIMVPVLTYFLNETQEKQNILKIIKNFMTKPLIVAPCLGIIYSLL